MGRKTTTIDTQMGRPPLPEDERKTVTLKVRFSPAQYDAVLRAAGEQSVAIWARTLLLAGAGHPDD